MPVRDLKSRLSCKVGLAESRSDVTGVLFFIEAGTRIQEKLACTQTNCTWIRPTYVTEVPHSRVKDIDFSSAKKLKKTLDQRIDSLHPNSGNSRKAQRERRSNFARRVSIRRRNAGCVREAKYLEN